MAAITVNDKRRFTRVAAVATDAVPHKPLSLDLEIQEVYDSIVAQHGEIDGEEAVKEQIRQQLLQQRVMYRSMLQRAEQELQRVTCRQLRPSELHTVKGLRQKYVLTVGKFVYGRDDTWLFEPQNDDVLERAMRFGRLKDAQHRGLQLHKQLLKTCVIDAEGKVTSEGWKQELAQNIAAELAALEVE